jgi:nicotinamidase-related amidase
MNSSKTALILIGFQKDYFSPDGILYDVIKSSSDKVLANTLGLLGRLLLKPVTIISTPIFFTSAYSELVDPVGILKTIRDVGAFKKGSSGSETIAELARFDKRITVVEGKRGLNAFRDTGLEKVLRDREITHVVFAGVVTSICIDSTARSAFEREFSVTVLSDCTAGRTDFEQDFYCKEIFPLYAGVMDSGELLEKLK